jgi:hypothetical protein
MIAGVLPSLLPDSIAALASFPVEQILVGFPLEAPPETGTKSWAPRFRFKVSDILSGCRGTALDSSKGYSDTGQRANR